ncbi:MAG TPA: hypothetical protein IGR64_08095 [Leptolyngbyaceae cyanobacterium M65_K2018_010]|nr:hypothetical protein [Leptolyngbyaceae cyanobacterium M65_K2018_010]
MAKLRSIRLGRLIVGLALALALWGCGLVNPVPPRAIVAAAIAQKVAATQALLSQQLALPEEAIIPTQVKSVRITDHHWITVANQSAVQVQGTYRLQGGGLARSQQRQVRDFTLVFSRGDSQDQWQVVDPVP